LISAAKANDQLEAGAVTTGTGCPCSPADPKERVNVGFSRPSPGLIGLVDAILHNLRVKGGGLVQGLLH
jgi:hypothetical protein